MEGVLAAVMLAVFDWLPLTPVVKVVIPAVTNLLHEAGTSLVL